MVGVAVVVAVVVGVSVAVGVVVAVVVAVGVAVGVVVAVAVVVVGGVGVGVGVGVVVGVAVVVAAVGDGSVEGERMALTVEIPMTLPSVSNLREHWAAKAKRVKAQRAATTLMLRSYDSGTLGRGVSHALSIREGLRMIPSNCRATITLTRVAPRKLDDDNLRGALKAVRDAVAAYFGVNDADPRIEWRYGQAKGAACVRIEIEMKP